MFKLTWVLGIFFLITMTVLRYLLMKNTSKYTRFSQLFFINSQVHGAEAFTLMGQLVGITWMVMGIFFDQIIWLPNGVLKDVLEEIVFYGPFLFYGWLLASKIRDTK